MIPGLYLSAQGAQIQQLRQEAISNNLANASTASFKRDMIRAQSHLSYDAAKGGASRLPHNQNDLPGGVTPFDVATDFSQGQLVDSKNQFDVAFAGKGFLQVLDGKRNLLTRDGQLAISPDGTLVTRDHGYPLQSPNNGGPITGLDPALPITVEADGLIRQGGGEVGRLAMIEPADYQMVQKVGLNLYSNASKVVPAPAETELKQGLTEQSGVKPVSELTELIEASRAFEANVNLIKHQDDALGRLLAVIPRH